MNNKEVITTIERVQQMEGLFDMVSEVFRKDSQKLYEDSVYKEMLAQLAAYLDSGDWLHDYEMDEQGLLPKDLKRGVLSQDALYDLLCEADNLSPNQN